MRPRLPIGFWTAIGATLVAGCVFLAVWFAIAFVALTGALMRLHKRWRNAS